jgi:hypothetical protein
VPIELGGQAPRAIAVESGDLDGDGRAELVIALSFERGARLVFVRNVNGVLVPDAAGVPLPQTLAGSEVSVALATGNLDHDPAHEVIAVVNEYREQPNAPPTGVARYYVLDAADRALGVVASGLVRATSGALNRTALTAGVAMADIDGDNLDEPIFAGLTHFDPDGDCDYRYLLVALDDLAHGLAPLGAREQDAGMGGQCRAGAPLRSGTSTSTRSTWTAMVARRSRSTSSSTTTSSPRRRSRACPASRSPPGACSRTTAAIRAASTATPAPWSPATSPPTGEATSRSTRRPRTSSRSGASTSPRGPGPGRGASRSRRSRATRRWPRCCSRRTSTTTASC